MLENAKASMLPYIEQFMFNPKELARAAHIDALSETLAPEGIIKKLEKLEWSVVEHCSNPAILPDCVCLSLDDEEGWQPLFLGGKDPRIVVFPLTPNKLLVGSKNDTSKFDTASFNDAAASVCLDFFLTGERHDELAFHHEALGDQLRGKIVDVIDESLAMAAQEYLQQDVKVIPEVESVPDQVEPKNDGTLSFALSLRGFGDEEFAKELGEKLQQIIIELLHNDSFHRIDGFTFACDYVGVLNDIDRGFDASPVETTPSEFGLGVAMPLTVRRDGVIKTHFVLRDILAVQLMHDDPQESAPALEILKSQLAGTYLQNLTIRKFPKQMLSRLEDEIELFLYRTANGVFDSYFSGRVCTTEHSDFEQAETLLNDQINAARNQIVTKRQIYRESGELDEFISYTLNALKQVLMSTARLIGMYHSCDNHRTFPDLLRVTLEDLEMLSWSRIFEKDLEAFFLGMEEWDDFEEILFTNRHLERWLLRFGILVELQKSEGVYIHVPLGSDAEHLLDLRAKEPN